MQFKNRTKKLDIVLNVNWQFQTANFMWPNKAVTNEVPIFWKLSWFVKKNNYGHDFVISFLQTNVNENSFSFSNSFYSKFVCENHKVSKVYSSLRGTVISSNA